VAIVGAEGHAAADFLSGTVRVIVSARAATGVQSVKLASGTVNFAAATPAVAPPLYVFNVDTTALADGDASLTATLTAGDGSTGTAPGTLHVDNAKPVITAFTVAGSTSTTITAGKTAALSASFSGGTASITANSGGSIGLASGAAVLVSPDVATSYNLRVTSRAGVTVQTGSTGQPPDVTVSVVSPASFSGTASVSPNTIQQGQSGNFTFTAPTFGASVVAAAVKDGSNATVGAITSGGTVQVPIPATAPGTTQLAYSLVLSNSATTPDATSIPVVVTVGPVPAPVISKFVASTVRTSSGVSVTYSLDVAGSTTGTPAVTGSCSPAVTVPGFSITLAGGSGSASSPAPAVAAPSTCTYKVTVQNGPTASAQASVVVAVEPLPTIASFVFQGGGPTATFAPGAGVVLDHTYDAQGGTATINGVTAGASGLTTPFNNIQASTVYTLRVTNLAGAFVTATATATVSALISSFSVGAALASSSGTVTISNGGTTKLFATFAGSGANGNAAAALSCAPSCSGTLGATTLSSGGNVTVTGSTNGTLTYTLTVTPSSGTPATATVTVKVVPLATAASLSASAPVIQAGNSVVLTPDFNSGPTSAVPGTATVVGSDGSTYANLTTLTPITVVPTLATTTYTLNVVNGAGTPAATAPTATITVVAAPGTWSALNDVTFTVRRGATVTALSSGKVLIAGGADTTGPLNSAVLCDATGACAAKTMGSARAFHTAVTIGGAGPNSGRVLLAGGFSTNLTTATTSAEFFDPVSESFANTTAITTSTVTTARARHIAVVLADMSTVLIAGGTADGTTNQSSAIKYLAGVAAPTTANVSNAMVQGARASFTGTLIGTTVLIVGGQAGNLTAELFDPAVGSGTFASTGALPTGEDKRSHTAVLIEGISSLAGKVLISGGVTGGTTRTATQFLYNPPPTGTFTPVVSLGTARSNHAAISLPNSSDMILICGGTDGTNTLSSCERYDPASGTGSMVGTRSMLEPRMDFGLAKMTISSILEYVAAGSPATLTVPVFAETFSPK
jgi:hypothetical protein